MESFREEAGREAGAAQYFNNLIFGMILLGVAFAGVPVVSDMTWKLIEARREGRMAKEAKKPDDD